MKITELGLSQDEIEKIRLIARIFRASRMTVENKLVDKQAISAILSNKEGK